MSSGTLVQAVRTVRVRGLEATDPVGSDVLGEIKRLGLGAFNSVLAVKVYRFEGCSDEDVKQFAQAIVDVDQKFTIDGPIISSARRVVEVGYRPGVMNPEAASLMKMGRDLGISSLKAADSSVEYHFYGDFSDDELDTVVSRLLVNKVVQMVVTETPATLIIQGEVGKVETVPLRFLDDTALAALSKDKLFLNLEEMHVIRDHFRNLHRDPTDVELETLAQTWSEHCGHKTFKARIIVDGTEKAPLFTRLKETSALFSGDVVSSFVDNSGVAMFYDGMAVCGKVETHNSPSAIEPYGGAATGSGGVFRDPMGTGQGAEVIASTDMFCFAPPDLPASQLPAGCLPPDYLLRRVVAGVRDYGNRMGIPTNNGSLYFHPDFRAKPTVVVGAYGIIPSNLAVKGHPQPGDLVLALGGRTGRDGIHGATFSSGKMTDQTAKVNSGAVQIGNAIEEQRLSRACLAIRDRGFVRAITDCGAGGFSSAIGELGKDTGVRVDLEKAPLKYPGLAPYEIWISESQERMVMAIEPSCLPEVLEICKGLNVEAVVLGYFMDDRRLVVAYNGEVVCDLSMEFLHDGLPQRTMVASWRATKFGEPTIRNCSEPEWVSRYLAVMGHLNVCSKEPIVRVYDHGVQGTNALSPFSGVRHDGPNDAVVLRPLHGKPYGLVISHGLNPILNRIDPYWGSVAAIVEALSNLVAVGGDYRQSWLIDNFIWPFPDEQSLGALDIAIEACCDMMKVFGRPFISGKDSLSSTYTSGELVIKIPPVLCVSAFGRIPDVAKTATADFKSSDSCILLVGNPDVSALGGSVFYDTLGCVGNCVPKPDLQCQSLVFRKIQEWIGSGKALAVHDLSDGGIAAALAEMCFGGEVGAYVNLDYPGYFGRNRFAGGGMLPEHLFFNETPGCFLVEVCGSDLYSGAFSGVPYSVLGHTKSERNIRMTWRKKYLFQVGLDVLRTAWQKPMKEVFSHE